MKFFDIVIVLALVVVGFLVWYYIPRFDFTRNIHFGFSTTTAIQITEPKNGERVSEYLQISGKARSAASYVNLRISDTKEDKILIEDEVIVRVPKMGEEGKWTYEMGIQNLKEGQKLKIEVFDYSLEGKKEINKTSVNVLVGK